MAHLVHDEIHPHNCYAEIRQDITQPVFICSLVECSCGKRFTLKDDLRDGPYWDEVK